MIKFCKNCNSEMKVDDVALNFPGNKDVYYICEKCNCSCTDQIRYGKLCKSYWYNEYSELLELERHN